MRPPGANIMVITGADSTWQVLRGLLDDQFTTVSRSRSTAELDHLECVDVIVVDRAALGDCDLTLRRIRQRRLAAYLMVIGARDEAEAGRLLDTGADDAVSLGNPLLESRLRAAARRARTLNAGTRIAIGDILFDRESRHVMCAGQRIRLTRTEEGLLDCFFWYAPQVVSVTDLASFVWGREETAERRNLVHVYVGYLRRKLSTSRQVMIRTIRGVGYELAAREANTPEP